MSSNPINIQVQPATTALTGQYVIPGDKSISHRALLLSALATGTSTIHGLLLGEDCLATWRALQAMGVKLAEYEKQVVSVTGVGVRGLTQANHLLDCGNSGTTMRLLAGILVGQTFDSTLIGDASLMRRPMNRIAEPLKQMQAEITTQSGLPPITIRGGALLRAIEYTLPMPSAQVKSAVLLAGLQASETTIIHQPLPCRDHTERMLAAFAYPLAYSIDRIKLQGGGILKATRIDIPADISSAAFLMVAASLIPGSEVILPKVGVNPTRTGIIDLLQQMGADITLLNARYLQEEPIADIRVRYAPLRGIVVPKNLVALAIDEFPIFMIAAACAEGTTKLSGAAELRVKESDRISAMVQGLTQLEIDVQALADGAVIQGGKLQGGIINSQGDHRIAMAFIIAGLIAQAPVVVQDCQNIRTSFPNFLALLQQANVVVEEV